MDHKECKGAINRIYAPKDKIFEAMEHGIKQANGHNVKPFNRKRNILVSSMTAAAVAGLTLASGFINPNMNHVLAEAPLIGKIYQEFGDTMGMQLTQQHAVKELNKSLTRNGITVKLSSAYFDGNVISVIGHVSGDLKKGMNEKGELSFDLNVEDGKGDNDPWLNGMVKDIRKKGKGYDFQWKLYYPYETINDDFTLPVTIHDINGIKGDWKFNIPVEQKNYRTVALSESKNDETDGVKIDMKELRIGKAYSSLTYEVVTKNKGDRISTSSAVNDFILRQKKAPDGYHTVKKAVFEKLDGNKELTIKPILSVADPAVSHSLSDHSFTLESGRTDMGLKVNSVKHQGNSVVIDYNFQNPPEGYNFTELKNNLQYEFMLIDKGYLDKIDLANPVPLENHSISKNHVQLLDKSSYHFQSTFPLAGDEKMDGFKLENTMLQFNFYSFIRDKDLEPISIEIPEQ
ncbi:DUF4179 domain-containing protein [Falsibacillus albus]|uniref:DUF4179 domain-containing protein n=1 Tax=Falsibacillus albus TaxID=2478915 RepID=A0A3L7K572_9BACI|nr:DUF4179 domain-containing protein [Falsibacillus albus]RLQ97429.1 DUF4179 domain-containing protein [Falsibacillus albus]